MSGGSLLAGVGYQIGRRYLVFKTLKQTALHASADGWYMPLVVFFPLRVEIFDFTFVLGARRLELDQVKKKRAFELSHLDGGHSAEIRNHAFHPIVVLLFEPKRFVGGGRVTT